MKIGDIAKRLNTTVRTLRFYEEEGLIHPRRSSGGTRLYDEADLARFEALLTLTHLDIPLQSIRELTAIRANSRTGNEASHQVNEKLQAMRDGLKAQLQAMRKAEQDIQQAQQLVSGCFSCRKRPIRKNCDPCEVSRDVETIKVLRVVWEAAARD